MIRTEKLTKAFGRGKGRFVAVNAIDIRVKKGEIHGFLGPNGAGKTTTIKMLVGAIRPSQGKAFIKGHPIGSVQARQLLGYSPERPSFYEHLTSVEYLEYMGRLGGVAKDAAVAKAKELLGWLELKDAMNRPVKGFSAGQKQRLGLAQALIHDPELLVLDEPTANLDPIGRSHLITKIKELSKKGITIFVSSHILPEIEKMADYVTIIHQGKIKVESEVSSIKEHFEGNHFVLSTSNNQRMIQALKRQSYVRKVWSDEASPINVIASSEEDLKRDIAKLLVKNNLALNSFSHVSMSLEQIFMEVVDGKD